MQARKPYVSITSERLDRFHTLKKRMQRLNSNESDSSANHLEQTVIRNGVAATLFVRVATTPAVQSIGHTFHRSISHTLKRVRRDSHFVVDLIWIIDQLIYLISI